MSGHHQLHGTFLQKEIHLDQTTVKYLPLMNTGFLCDRQYQKLKSNYNVSN